MPKEMEKLKLVVKKIIRRYNPEKIILFGSWVWGKPDKDSDFDLLIIKNVKKRKLDRIYDVYKILEKREIPIDIIVFTPQS